MNPNACPKAKLSNRSSCRGRPGDLPGGTATTTENGLACSRLISGHRTNPEGEQAPRRRGCGRRLPGLHLVAYNTSCHLPPLDYSTGARCPEAKCNPSPITTPESPRRPPRSCATWGQCPHPLRPEHQHTPLRPRRQLACQRPRSQLNPNSTRMPPDQTRNTMTHTTLNSAVRHSTTDP